MIKKLRKTFKNTPTTVATFVVLFAICGTIALLLTRAATVSVSVEAENGTLSGNAAKITGDPTASNNSYVRFTAARAGNGPYETIDILTMALRMPYQTQTILQM
mgnify:CR=1 FL=1